MQKWLCGILFTVILLSFSTIPLRPVLPQLSFMITPVVKEIQTKPGEKEIYTLKIINSSESRKKLKLRLYPLDFSLNSQGEIVFFPPRTLKRSASGWLTLNPSQLTVFGGTTEKVQVSINIPQEVQGGYYTAIAVENVPETSVQEQMGAVTWRMISMLVLIVQGMNQPAGDIIVDDLAIKADEAKEEIVFEVTLKNKGDVHVKTQGILIIEDEDGKKVEEISFIKGSGTIFPGSVRKFKINVRKLPPPGKYVLKVVVKYDSKKETQAQLPFTIREKGRD